MRTGLTMLSVVLLAALAMGCRSGLQPGMTQLQVVTHDEVGDVTFTIDKVNNEEIDNGTQVYQAPPGSYAVELSATSRQHGETYNYETRQIVEMPEPGYYILHVNRSARHDIDAYVEKQGAGRRMRRRQPPAPSPEGRGR